MSKTFNDLSWLNTKTALLIIALFTAGLYANSLFNGYALDDNLVIQNNELTLKGFKAIPEIFTSRYFTSKEQSIGYRPITNISFAVEYGLFGERPFISHLINLFLYLSSMLMVFLILRQVLKKFHIIFPFVITLLFLAHPIHTEVVNNIKSRDELLWFFNGMIALWFFLKYADHEKFRDLAIGTFFFLFAILSKQFAVSLAIATPLFIYFFKQYSLKSLIVPPAIMSTMYLMYDFYDKRILSASIYPDIPGEGIYQANSLNLFADFKLFIGSKISNAFHDTFYFLQDGIFKFAPMLDGFGIGLNKPTIRDPLFFEFPLYFVEQSERIGTIIYAIGKYFQLLLLPHPLVCYYGFDEIPIADLGHPVVLATIALLVVLFAITAYLFLKKHYLGFGFALMIFSLIFFANIFKYAPGVVAERYLYLPSLGFVFILAFALLKLAKVPFEQIKQPFTIKNTLWFLLIPVLALYSFKTVTRNMDWKSEEILYSNDVVHADKSVKLNHLLGQILLRKHLQNKDFNESHPDYQAAEKALKISVDRYPAYTRAWNNLAFLYVKTGQYNKAMPVLDKALELDYKYIEAYNNKAIAYFNTGQANKAIAVYREMVEIDPTNNYSVIGARNAAEYYLKNNEPVKAIEIANFAIKGNPKNPGVPEVMAIQFDNYGQTDLAIDILLDAVKDIPNNRNLLKRLITYYQKTDEAHLATPFVKKLNGLN